MLTARARLLRRSYVANLAAVSGNLMAHASVLAALLAVSACTVNQARPPAQRAKPPAPYPHSKLVWSVTWNFATVWSHRKAHGSDLWPCAWAADDDLYCAWGDGGGFDGDDDRIGRVSLGFARLSGTPREADPDSFSGKNIWGEPPYAEASATFGGKVGSMIALDGVLYALGGFWTPDNARDPAHTSGRGPLNTIAWSADGAKNWHVAAWSSAAPLGSFLDAGKEPVGAAPDTLLMYYLRAADSRHVYLKRVRTGSLRGDPATAQGSEYFRGTRHGGREALWSLHEQDAVPIFTDDNHVEGPSVVFDAGLGRYLLTAGHYASGNDDDSSAGQVGLFESPHPWGPWATIGYYENWGNLKADTAGDFLSLRLPSKWLSADGTAVWAVFSGPRAFDSFNVVRGKLTLR